MSKLVLSNVCDIQAPSLLQTDSGSVQENDLEPEETMQIDTTAPKKATPEEMKFLRSLRKETPDE